MAGTAVATGVTGSVQPRGAAELTWALIMALVRNVPAEAASLRAGGWQVSVGGDLEGRTMGILGFVTGDTYRIFYRDTVENILAWLEGRPVRVMNG